ncbi:hypothetical protein [Arthrobacter castelli]|uniref:hypothetical protein n=1 Tax=Arthrobacter castelli TaxID=271431 RepID=UPI0003F916F5|nr:hypothetical protein [Arthrobacter castelli]
MSTPPQDPNQPPDPNRKPDDDGNQDQPEQPQYGQPDDGRPRYDQPQYGQPQQDQPQYGEHAPGYGQPRPGQSVAGQQPPMEHQNPAGQPPYGQDPGAQPPYGYPAGQPAAYGYPGGQGQFAQPGPVQRPREVEISFWLIIAAAVLTAVTTIVTLAALGSPAMMEQFEMIMGQQGGQAPMDAQALIGAAAVFIVIIGIIGIGLYLLLGFMVRKGKNWARITATVLAALSLLTMIGASFLWIITVLLGVAAVVLLFLPKSSNYFNAIKAQKFGAYGQ